MSEENSGWSDIEAVRMDNERLLVEMENLRAVTKLSVEANTTALKLASLFMDEKAADLAAMTAERDALLRALVEVDIIFSKIGDSDALLSDDDIVQLCSDGAGVIYQIREKYKKVRK